MPKRRREKKEDRGIEAATTEDAGRDVALENKLINTRRAIIPPRIVSRRYLPPGCPIINAHLFIIPACVPASFTQLRVAP